MRRFMEDVDARRRVFLFLSIKLDCGPQRFISRKIRLTKWASTVKLQRSQMHFQWLFPCRPVVSLLGSSSNDNDDDDDQDVKKQLFLWANQQLFTCISLFSTFLWRPVHNCDVLPPYATFYRGRTRTTTNVRRRFFLSLFEPGWSP